MTAPSELRRRARVAPGIIAAALVALAAGAGVAAAAAALHASGSTVVLRGRGAARARVTLSAALQGTVSSPAAAGFELQAPPTLSYLVVHLRLANTGRSALAMAKVRVTAMDAAGKTYGVDPTVDGQLNPTLPTRVAARASATEVLAILVPRPDPGVHVVIDLAGGAAVSYAVRR